MSLAEVTLRQGDEHMKDVPIELIQGLACVFNGNILAASKNLITEITSFLDIRDENAKKT